MRTPGTAGAASDAIAIKLAEPEEYYAVADAHCQVFYPRARQPAAKLLRLDRCFALQVNDRLQHEGVGRAACFVAWDPPTARRAAAGGAPAARQASAAQRAWSDPLSLARFVLEPDIVKGLGASHAEAGVLGCMVVDTFGDLVPPKTLSPRRDGAFGWVKREGYAYLSNVAVTEAARRRGVARQLMAAAEQQAAAWGCRCAVLHCNPSNTAAAALYASLGYRRTALEPLWVSWWQGRGGDQCHMWVKRLPAPAAGVQGASSATQPQQGRPAAAAPKAVTGGGNLRQQAAEPMQQGVSGAPPAKGELLS